MTDIRCLFLDMGKVLLDFDWKRFGDRIREVTGVTQEQLQAALAAENLARRYESGLISDAEFHQAVCRGVGREISMEDFTSGWNSIFFPDPILPEDLVRTVASRTDLWVISNTNRLHFDFVAGNYPVLRHFRGFVLSHEVRAMKPDERIFRAALSRAGVAATEALFVDDQMPNVAAARELGMDAFQFVSPEQFAGELQRRDIL